MHAGPLIVRELREQSRRPLTYLLRLLGAGGLLFVLYRLVHVPSAMAVRWTAVPGGVAQAIPFTWLENLEAGLKEFENRGDALFQLLHLAMLAGIWFLGPMLTADCLSRERREGTLGLLFLTPLRAGDIVFAKFSAHFLRAGSVLLAAVPFLLLPLLLGGVSWTTVVRAVLTDLGALILALSAGLLASTLWNGPRAVLFGAVTLAAVAALAWVVGWTFVEVVGGGPGPARPVAGVAVAGAPVWELVERMVQRRVETVISYASMTGGAGPGVTAMVVSRQAPTGTRALTGALGLLGIALVLSSMAFWVAWRSVVRSQREGRPVGAGARAEEWLGRPRYFSAWLERLRARVLAREPVLWTEFRTWRLRVGVWVLPLALAPFLVNWVSVAAYGNAERYELPVQVLLLLMAMSAASCLQTERATGVLELLLTVPAGARHVAGGKLRALVLQALPGAVLLVGVAAALFIPAGMTADGIGGGWRQLFSFSLALAGRLAFVIGVGSLASLRCRGFFPALFVTLAAVLAAELIRSRCGGSGGPFRASGGLVTFHYYAPRWPSMADLWSLVQLGAGITSAGLLAASLRRRRFSAQ